VNRLITPETTGDRQEGEEQYAAALLTLSSCAVEKAEREQDRVGEFIEHHRAAVGRERRTLNFPDALAILR
jgi:hypothetical protein